MLTIIHGADFHLDSPFACLTPQRAAQRRGEQRELLSALAELSRQRRADLVLLSGDLLDSHQTYRETAQALSQALGQIPCPVFLAPGNHDYYHINSLYAALDWPENVHIFTSGDLEAVELPQLGCVVHGRAFQASREDASPLAGFSAPQDGTIHLMVLHGQVDGAGDYAPISREDIAASGLTYLALGHVHQCSGVQREGNTFWAYPGCPEGSGFDETGEKGVLYEIHRLACFANEYENDFIKAMVGRSAKVAENDRVRKKRELDGLLARDRELDMLFERLYEDNVSGKIDDARFAKMSKRYEQEQGENAGRIKALRLELKKLEDKRMDVDAFLETVRRYTDATTITKRMVAELIQYIEVYPAVKEDGITNQRVTIHYNCIGAFEVPDRRKIPERDILLETRKGVALSYAPTQIAI